MFFFYNFLVDFLKNLIENDNHLNQNLLKIVGLFQNEILPFATTWVELESIMLSEINWRKTNTLISLLCGIKNKTSVQWKRQKKRRRLAQDYARPRVRHSTGR